MIKAILTDIEGTTSSLAFVKDTLFPYARERIGEFVRQHANEPNVRELLDQARDTADTNLDNEGLVEQLIRWIDEDRKIPPLKALQGLIWEEGYRQGQLKGHVYEDAVRNLRRWHDQGISLFVFSSGSVRAQELLFSHTEYGDLTPLFNGGHFDTRIGAKTDSAAYGRIADEIGVAPERILFLSDVQAELDAARDAGMDTRWLNRGEAPSNSVAGHVQVPDFDAISF